ncbi:MAG: 5'/3'-nucleotidase SurE [Actinomycetota bacterium]
MSERVLVTNDDGIDGPGLRELTATLVAHGYEPLVVAPDRDYSGAAGSLLSLSAEKATFDQSTIRYERRVLEEAPDVEAYAIEGPPALCALIAMRETFGPAPTLVTSGINYGLNVGPAVMHSGTVNAALVGARAAGVPAIAISAHFNPDDPDTMRYDTAAQMAMRVLAAMPSAGHQVVSLNVPCCDISEVKGLRSGTLAPRFAYRSFMEVTDENTITRTYKEDPDVVIPEGSDTALIYAGYASVSALTAIGAVDCSDLVDAVVEASA